jgi:hypothetical protein
MTDYQISGCMISEIVDLDTGQQVNGTQFFNKIPSWMGGFSHWSIVRQPILSKVPAQRHGNFSPGE